MTRRNGRPRDSQAATDSLRPKVQVRIDGHVTIVSLLDEDLGSSRTLRNDSIRELLLEIVSRLETTKMVIDISEVKHMGAALMGSLALVATRLKQHGRELLILGDNLGMCRSLVPHATSQQSAAVPVAVAIATAHAGPSLGNSRLQR